MTGRGLTEAFTVPSASKAEDLIAEAKQLLAECEWVKAKMMFEEAVKAAAGTKYSRWQAELGWALCVYRLGSTQQEVTRAIEHLDGVVIDSSQYGIPISERARWLAGRLRAEAVATDSSGSERANRLIAEAYSLILG